MTDQSIDAFLTTFNRLHKVICKELQVDDQKPFATVVKSFEKLHPQWPHADDLLVLARLRNLLAHEYVLQNESITHPSQWSIRTLHIAIESVENPIRVTPRFAREVEVIGIKDRLGDVLPRVLTGNYSQFPVYDDHTFVGLLTESGVVRFLANNQVSGGSTIELATISVLDLLMQDNNRTNCDFAPENERLDTLLERFSHNPILEAVLITATGKKEEKLIGIATQWDAVEALKERV